MKHIRGTRRRTASAAVAVCSSLVGIALFAPSALALVAPLGGASITVAPQPHSTVFHAVVAGGLAGWQITLIACGSALFSATVAVVVDHVRAARRTQRVSAA
jgi:hypothetical protein